MYVFAHLVFSCQDKFDIKTIQLNFSFNFYMNNRLMHFRQDIFLSEYDTLHWSLVQMEQLVQDEKIF